MAKIIDINKYLPKTFDEAIEATNQEIDMIYDKFYPLVHDEYIDGADMFNVMMALLTASDYVYDIMLATQENDGTGDLPETFELYMQELFGFSVTLSNEE